MSNQNKELTIPEFTKVYEDPKTKAKTVAIPFTLPEGINAALMICRLHKGEWKPQKQIKKITIEYHEN